MPLSPIRAAPPDAAGSEGTRPGRARRIGVALLAALLLLFLPAGGVLAGAGALEAGLREALASAGPAGGGDRLSPVVHDDRPDFVEPRPVSVAEDRTGRAPAPESDAGAPLSAQPTPAVLPGGVPSLEAGPAAQSPAARPHARDPPPSV